MEFKTVWSRFSYSKFLIVTVLIMTFTLFLHPIAYVNAQRPGDYIVAEYGAGILSRITPYGVRTVIYTFPAGTYIPDVAIDSEGNYIVTEESTDILSRITPDGVRTVIYTFPAGVFLVAIDSEGNYIVTEYTSDILSKITPDGVRTVIYTFTGNPAPSGVAIDSEGNYIVTEESTDIICKITLGGSRTVIFTFADDTDPWGVAIYPAIPAPVGGVATSVNKLEILTPYIALAGLIITVSTVYVIKRRKA